MVLFKGDRVEVTPISLFKGPNVGYDDRIRANDIITGHSNVSLGDRVTVDPIGIRKSGVGVGDLLIADGNNDRITSCYYTGSFGLNAGSSGTGDNQMDLPHGICSDGIHCYHTDFNNDRIIKRKCSDLSYVSKIGTLGTGDDQFYSPMFITTDKTHIYIGDFMNHRIKKHLCSNLSYVSKIGTYGTGDDQFTAPYGICNDGTHLYIVDSNRIVKRLCSDLSFVSKITTNCYGICTDGTHLYTSTWTLLSYTMAKRKCSDLSFVSEVTYTPGGQIGIVSGCVHGDYLYATDTANHRISVYRTSDLSYANSFGTLGTGPNNLKDPWDVCLKTG